VKGEIDNAPFLHFLGLGSRLLALESLLGLLLLLLRLWPTGLVSVPAAERTLLLGPSVGIVTGVVIAVDVSAGVVVHLPAFGVATGVCPRPVLPSGGSPLRAGLSRLARARLGLRRISPGGLRPPDTTSGGSTLFVVAGRLLALGRFGAGFSNLDVNFTSINVLLVQQLN